MKNTIKTAMNSILVTCIAATIGMVTQPVPALAGGGGGGGGGQNPPPAVPVPTYALTFDPSPAVNGVVPSCTGYFSITPYWLGASKVDITLDYRSLNLPVGTQLFVTSTTSGFQYGTIFSVVTTLGQKGRLKSYGFILPDAMLTSIVVTDAAGNLIFSGH